MTLCLSSVQVAVAETKKGQFRVNLVGLEFFCAHSLDSFIDVACKVGAAERGNDCAIAGSEKPLFPPSSQTESRQKGEVLMIEAAPGHCDSAPVCILARSNPLESVSKVLGLLSCTTFFAVPVLQFPCNRPLKHVRSTVRYGSNRSWCLFNRNVFKRFVPLTFSLDSADLPRVTSSDFHRTPKRTLPHFFQRLKSVNNQPQRRPAASWVSGEAPSFSLDLMLPLIRCLLVNDGVSYGTQSSCEVPFRLPFYVLLTVFDPGRDMGIGARSS